MVFTVHIDYRIKKYVYIIYIYLYKHKIRRITVLHLADQFGSRSLGQTLPVAKSALSQWQPGPTFKEHKASV